MTAAAVQGDPLKIGDVARLAELSVDAVRFYEREGLLGRVRRHLFIARCDGHRWRKYTRLRCPIRVKFDATTNRKMGPPTPLRRAHPRAPSVERYRPAEDLGLQVTLTRSAIRSPVPPRAVHVGMAAMMVRGPWQRGAE